MTYLEGTAGTLAGGAQAIIDVARSAAKPTEIDLDRSKVHAFVVPAGGSVHTVDIDDEARQPAPNRTRGEYVLATQASFTAYVNSALAPEQRLTLWVDEPSTRVTAVFNDATADTPAWRDHRAVLKLTLTDEWMHWLALSGHLVEQEMFAEHIEDGLAEIREPDSATMLEIAQTFHATASEEVASVRRLRTGEITTKWSKETAATAGFDGNLEIPEILHLAIPVFVGDTEACAIEARIRYRVKEGKLTIGYKLDHPERVVHFAMEALQTSLTAEFGGVYLGGAPAPAVAGR